MTPITCENIMIRPLCWGLQSIYSTEGDESGSVTNIENSDGILVISLGQIIRKSTVLAF